MIGNIIKSVSIGIGLLLLLFLCTYLALQFVLFMGFLVGDDSITDSITCTPFCHFKPENNTQIIYQTVTSINSKTCYENGILINCSGVK